MPKTKPYKKKPISIMALYSRLHGIRFPIPAIQSYNSVNALPAPAADKDKGVSGYVSSDVWRLAT